MTCVHTVKFRSKLSIDHSSTNIKSIIILQRIGNNAFGIGPNAVDPTLESHKAIIHTEGNSGADVTLT